MLTVSINLLLICKRIRGEQSFGMGETGWGREAGGETGLGLAALRLQNTLTLRASVVSKTWI